MNIKNIKKVLLSMNVGLAAAFVFMFMQPTTVAVQIAKPDLTKVNNIQIYWVDRAEAGLRKLAGKDTNFRSDRVIDAQIPADTNYVIVNLPTRFVRSIRVVSAVSENSNSEELTVTGIGAEVPTDSAFAGNTNEFNNIDLDNYDLLIFGLLLAVNTSVSLFVFRKAFLKLLKLPSYFIALGKKADNSRYAKKLNMFGERFSEDGLIKFDYKVITVIGASILAFICIVSFNIHFSSIGAWDTVFTNGEIKDKTSIIGQAKSIRSDEFMVRTPAVFSQAENDFSLTNKSMGTGVTPLLMNLPVNDPLMVARPQMWGYFVFGAERGMSWEMGFKTVLAFAAIFSMILILTQNNFLLSLSGAVWIMFSSFIQWWFPPELVGLIAIMFVLLSYILALRRAKIVLPLGFLVGILLVDYVLFLYPPFQISLGYVLVALFAAQVVRYRKQIFTRKLFWLKAASGLIAVAIIAICLGHFYSIAKDTITQTMNTVYPGSRAFLGGGTSYVTVFAGFFTFLNGENFYPSTMFNVCEAANFVLIGVLVIPVAIWKWLRSKVRPNAFVVALSVYLLLNLLWIFLPLPEFLSKFTLMSMVPPTRDFIGIGVASILLAVIYLGSAKEIKFKLNLKTLISLVATFVGFFVLWLKMKNALGSFPPLSVLGICLVVLIVGVYALFTHKKTLFALFVIAISLPNILVNPVVIGFEPLDVKTNKLLSYAKEVGGEWVVYNKSYVADYLKSTGVYVLNGIKYVPDWDVVTKLDPAGKYKDIYNRYAHVNYAYTEGDEIEFSLPILESYEIKVNPCNPVIKELGVQHVVFVDEKADKFQCLEFKLYDERSNSYVYDLK